VRQSGRESVWSGIAAVCLDIVFGFLIYVWDCVEQFCSRIGVISTRAEHSRASRKASFGSESRSLSSVSCSPTDDAKQENRVAAGRK
jgi:hypothetical protein